MATPLDIRPVPEEDVERMLELHDLVFHVRSEPPLRDRHLRMLRAADRLGAFDGDRLVGMLAAVPTPLRLPAAQLPCAVVTFVAVAPTHRRRGLLDRMMAELWERCARSDVALAGLWAAEAVIYPRYGFGAANRIANVEIASDRPLGLRVEPDPAPLRLVDPSADAPLIAELYERARQRRPGQLARDERTWSDIVLPDRDPDGAGPPRVVVLGEPGRERGYAIHRVGWSDGGAVVRLEELEADTPHGEAALWRYLASIDLTARVRCRRRPVDDPLGLLVEDPDRVTVERTLDWLWLRLIDLPAALQARGWAADVDLVIEVDDATIPANAGRWRLQTGGHGARVGRTSTAPQLALDTRDLAAAYLGGRPVAELVGAGLADERADGAAATLDAALRTRRAPFTNDCF